MRYCSTLGDAHYSLGETMDNNVWARGGDKE